MLTNILGWPNSSLRFSHTVDIASLVTENKYAIARLVVVFFFFFSKLVVREDIHQGQNVRFTGFVKTLNLSRRKVVHKTSCSRGIPCYFVSSSGWKQQGNSEHYGCSFACMNLWRYILPFLLFLSKVLSDWLVTLWPKGRWAEAALTRSSLGQEKALRKGPFCHPKQIVHFVNANHIGVLQDLLTWPW